MTHAIHTDEEQILADNCSECDYRAADITRAIANLDSERFIKAWARAGELQLHGLPNASQNELELLRVLAVLEIQFERLGVPIGVMPTKGVQF